MDIAHLIEMIPLQACVCDENGNIVVGNSSWRAFFATAGATHILNLISTSDHPQLKMALTNLGAHSSIQSNRLLLETLQNPLESPQSFTPTEWVLHSDPDKSGKICCFVLATSTTTSKAHFATEHSLAESNTLLNAVLDNLPLAVFVKDVQSGFKIVSWNRKCEEVSKISAENAVGKTDFDILPAAYAKQSRARDEATIQQGFALEIPALHYDFETSGQVFHQFKVPVFDNQGKAKFLVGISNDITQMKKAEAEISTLTTMIHTSREIYLYCTLDGKILFMNQGSMINFGWSPQGDHLSDLIPAQSHGRFFGTIVPEMIEGGKQWQGEIDLVNRNSGASFPAWVNLFTVKPAISEIEVLCFTALDLTVRREQEQLLANASKLSALGEMAGGIAHEINNPLSIIMGKAKVLSDMAATNILTPEKLIADVAKIEATAKRISAIVNGLRTLSRTADRDPIEPISISNLIHETLELCQHRFRNHDTLLSVTPFSDTILNCRPAQIVQILVNLLNNSFDSVQERQEKWVRIDVTSDATVMEIAVTDSGDGIAPEILEKLMQPFFSTKPKGKGTGLGLSISRRIAEQHGGTLEYDPASPKTRFVIHLPISKIEAAAA